MPPDPRIIRTFDAFSEQRQGMVDKITGLVGSEFAGFDGWYRPSLIDEVTAQVGHRVSVGQRGIAALTDAYLARVSSFVLDRPVSAAGVPPSFGDTLRSGPANHEEVYARVAAEYRYQRSVGASDTGAQSKANLRAQEMVGTDLDLAHQRQVQRFNTTRGITTYRRVIRSEKTCGLCAGASHQTYHRADLLPIHARCRCGVLPVTANDPGSQINDDTLAEIYAAAGSTKAADLKRVEVAVKQHGELGPQLREAGQNFRGPADIPDAARGFISPGIAPVKRGFDPEPYRRAQTAQEAGDLLQKHIGDRGVVSGFDASGLDVHSVRETTEQLAYLFDKNPDIRANVAITTLKSKDTFARAMCRKVKGGKFIDMRMEISLGRMRASEQTQQVFEEAASKGHFHAPHAGDTGVFRYSVTHEFGHLMDYATKQAMNPHGMERTAIAKQGIRFKSPEHTIWRKQNISGYGQASRAEMIAEAFADVEINGAEASAFSRTIYDVLTKLEVEL